jgi:hypothetical protein
MKSIDEKIPYNGPFLENLTVVQIPMESDAVLLPWWHKPINGPYLVQDKSHPLPSATFL